MEALGYGRDNTFITFRDLNSEQVISSENYSKYAFENNDMIEYFKKDDGLRSNYIIANKIEGDGNLQFALQ